MKTLGRWLIQIFSGASSETPAQAPVTHPRIVEHSHWMTDSAGRQRKLRYYVDTRTGEIVSYAEFLNQERITIF